ncbi:gluconokinase [Actinoplanes ianthinogenes]|uniref:Gluconokinase n=1 Tax=Actinoplanes ianthinogenes TaxID=122358 RepID=A0ABM7M218_9ACTN|nr:gluconokinase [Actinoplanes ianthinogenes]BCJ45635.1 gluconokinase [Actinoplanes ianthinogenes]GGR33047.1 gluconokinase [Actinoplanes ianthinogenes]
MVPIVVMGVAGCGKSTVGKALADRLGVPYKEADAFHPAANVAKMHGGVPLTDEDRAPWLAAIAASLGAGDVVVSCSALKRAYRNVLRGGNPDVFFVHLVLSPETATARVSGRAGHFMPSTLVASQFAILEPLEPDESGVAVDATLPVDKIVEKAISRMPTRRG